MQSLNNFMSTLSTYVLFTLKWGAIAAGVLIAGWLIYRAALWLWGALSQREYKRHLFTLEGWFVTFVHDAVMVGVVMIALISYVKWEGGDIELFIPEKLIVKK